MPVFRVSFDYEDYFLFRLSNYLGEYNYVFAGHNFSTRSSLWILNEPMTSLPKIKNNNNNSTAKTDAENGQVLLEAVKYGNNELLRELLSAGDSLHYLDYADDKGFTALHYAASLNDTTCLQLLLSAGADANVSLNRSKTPLHIAAENGNVESCKILADAGADVFFTDKDGYSSLEVAQMRNHQNVAFVLLDAIEQRQQKINDLKSRLDNACVNGSVNEAECVLRDAGSKFLPLIINGHRDDYTPLYRSCERGHCEIAKLLIKHGADERVHPVTSFSPLYVAVQHNFENVVELLLESFPHLAQVASECKWLPFHAAAESGSVECAKRLLNYPYASSMLQTYSDSSNEWDYDLPFDVNAQDANCRTPLFIACESQQLKFVEFLLEFNVTARQSRDKIQKPSSSVEQAVDAYEEVTYAVSDAEALTGSTDDSKIADNYSSGTLKKARSKLNAQKNPNATNKSIVKIEKRIKPVGLDVYSAKGYTPLHVAVMKSNMVLVKMLVDAGADLNLPLALTEDDLIRLQMEEIQICGSGALIEACRHNNTEMVDYLLEKGAIDHDNKALAVCVSRDCDDLACKLLSRQVFNDPEFRINKKCADLDASTSMLLAKGRTVVPSSLFPACPVMLNWHSASLRHVKPEWLQTAALHLNPKLAAGSSFITPSVISAAITRIDVAKNQLTELPICIFQMASLRILNVANNKLERLPAPLVESSVAKAPAVFFPSSGASLAYQWNVPVLEEIHIEHNHLETLPTVLFELPNLQGLDVSYNHLTSLPGNIWSAVKLKDLNVSFNQLKSLPNVSSIDFYGCISLSSSSNRSTSLSVDVDSPVPPGEDPTTSLASPSLSSGFKSNDITATTTTTTATTNEDSDEKCSMDSFRFGRVDDTLSYQELKRHNLWQKSLELSRICDDDVVVPTSSASGGKFVGAGKSCLTSLNLCHNTFERIPEGLPCVCPTLSRLNVSHNKLTEIGPVNAYPPRLKHLDLSNNRIKVWFGTPTGGYCSCGTPTASSPSTVTPRPVSPVSGRRSHSVARSNRSLSVVAARSSEPLSLLAAQPICIHRRHNRLENLRTLVLAGNALESLILTVQTAVARNSIGGTGSSSSNRRQSSGRGGTNEKSSTQQSPSIAKSEIVFPHLSMLDVSNNLLRQVPGELSEISTLSVLNLSNNVQVTNLPPDMGLLSRLWNLNLSGCTLGEPLKSMLESKRYKTMDIIGYLKSILEDSKTYMRLKLMIVGVQGIGKTSILEQVRQEGSGSYKKQPAEGWAKRMGNKNINQKTNRGVNISTVGVDVNDWTYEPRRSKHQPSYGPITFRTWDFGGQREYYATHQYFLSKRSLYLVVWRVTDGEAGVSEITQWLVNIQARAPNSPVIIVGTHYDEIVNNSKKFPQGFIEDLQKMIRERFVAVQDADKKGLPRVVDSVIISCKTRFNIRVLCDLIYHTAYELRSPGSKDRLLEQKVPASYLALEEIVCQLAFERKQQNQDPVLTASQFRSQVQEYMKKQFNKQFRDAAELNQATAFLHENGVLLHYDDATLKDLYFLDPQWLCDILAHVITIREINPFAKNGLMKTDDLKILFKSSKFTPSNIRFYILNLIQKFEVALTWDNRTLLIPSLLPDEYQLRAGYPDCEVKIPLRSRGWIVRAVRNLSSNSSAEDLSTKPSTFVYYTSHDRPSPLFETKTFQSPTDSSDAGSTFTGESGVEKSQRPKFVPLFTLNRPKKSAEELDAEFYVNCSLKDDACLRRLYIMAYVPSGFWSRLITRLLGDEILPNLFDEYFKFAADVSIGDDAKLRKILEANKAEWLLWQTGVEVKFLNRMLFSLKEFLPLAEIRDYNYKDTKFKCRLENSLVNVDTEHTSITEVVVPSLVLTIRYQNAEGKAKLVTMETDLQAMTKLLAMVVETVDTLLEDWYPSLGTRFVHTSEGKYLINRLVPCPYCLIICGKQNLSTSQTEEDNWTILSLNNNQVVAPNKNVAQKDGRIVKSKTFDNSSDRQRRLSSSSQDSGMIESGFDAAEIVCVRSASLYDVESARTALTKTAPLDYAYAFTIEELILAAHESTLPKCPCHGPMTLSSLAPDTVFLDLGTHHLIVPEQVKRGKMLGRGAFGFVFKASVKFQGQNHATDVALKMLQPVDPGFGAKQSAISAYKAAWAKWQRDPMQYSCRAYCTARQELSVLLNLKHSNVVPLIGVCTRPLALALGLAPLGSLNSLLQNYRRSGAYLNVTVIQETVGQVAKALEYLHQQRIIYRDLKSDNVLVWQYPPPFSKLTTVEIKLGDYGISRSILPTGGAKGFGGTEGYMAPEIMRYNGEEEYTEKADCFSFAMFLYELLTLKMPFEGQEQIKEYILDGGRPVLTTKELLYPSNVVDLMVVCWSQQPTDRPSSSQLVSITAAPEFAHLLDVVSLNDSDAMVVAGEAFTIDDGGFVFDESSLLFEGETWLSRADGLVAVLTCNQHGWLDYKNIVVNEESFVTALCLVEDTIWMGELTGIIRVYCVKTYSEMSSFPLAPYVLPNDDSPKHQCSIQIVELIYCATIKSVLVAISQPGFLLLCRTNEVFAGRANVVVAGCKSPQGAVHCCAVVPVSEQTLAVWCGHSAGYVSLFTTGADTLHQSAIVNHYEPVVEGLDVSRLVSSPTNGRYVWSYVYPGCVLYQWDVNERVIVSKLDCSKIAPCSESINTMNIDERLSPGRCQVTALTLVEKEDGTQLYIGTTWGVIIVTEADQLKPITALRPHVDDVRVIIPVSQAKRATVTLSPRHRPSSTSAHSRGSETRAPPANGKGSQSNTAGSGRSTANGKTSGLADLYGNGGAANGVNSSYVITIGKGYRSLIQRFLDNYKEESSILESRNKDIFAVLWRTDDWLNY